MNTPTYERASYQPRAELDRLPRDVDREHASTSVDKVVKRDDPDPDGSGHDSLPKSLLVAPHDPGGELALVDGNDPVSVGGLLRLCADHDDPAIAVAERSDVGCEIQLSSFVRSVVLALGVKPRLLFEVTQEFPSAAFEDSQEFGAFGAPASLVAPVSLTSIRNALIRRDSTHIRREELVQNKAASGPTPLSNPA